ncbi:unnamed protein product [Coffea canephora]|uniref:S1-like domain-containing protein n=1 Tax=Coffea canephora TaxID=49390 RepID=A0A068VEW0_COFCA|nr:unnamed protein product [Coffea canephora]
MEFCTIAPKTHSILYPVSNQITLPTLLNLQNLNIKRLSNAVSLFDPTRSCGGGGGWSGKLTLTSRGRPVIEAKRKEKTGWSADQANPDELKWIHLGQIVESLSNGMFRALVPIRNVGPIIGYGSGKMRTNRILILPGDVVKVELGRYDPARGRIVYRFHPKEWKKKAEKEEDEEEEGKFEHFKGEKRGKKQRS